MLPSQCWHLLIILFQFAVFLGFGKMSGFQLKPMHYEYYAMIFWISFKPFLLPGFFWHCSGRIKQRGEWGTTLLLPSVCRSQVPHFAFIGPQGSSPYLLLGGGGSPDLSCDLHWHCWRLEGHFLLGAGVAVGNESSASLLSLFQHHTSRKVEMPHYSRARVNP